MQPFCTEAVPAKLFFARTRVSASKVPPSRLTRHRMTAWRTLLAEFLFTCRLCWLSYTEHCQCHSVSSLLSETMHAARVEPRPQYLTLSTCTCRKPWPRCVMCVDGVVSSVFLLRSILTFDCRWWSCVSSYIVKTYIICLVVRLGRSGYKFSFAEIHSTWSNLGFGTPRLQRLRLWRLFDGCIVTSVCSQVSVHAINFPGCVRLPLATVCYPL